MKALRWHEEDQGQTFDVTEIPTELGAAAEEAREELVETVASEDDDLPRKVSRRRGDYGNRTSGGISFGNVKQQDRSGVMVNGSEESRSPTVTRCRY